MANAFFGSKSFLSVASMGAMESLRATPQAVYFTAPSTDIRTAAVRGFDFAVRESEGGGWGIGRATVARALKRRADYLEAIEAKTMGYVAERLGAVLASLAR